MANGEANGSRTDDELGAVSEKHLIFLEPPWAIPFGELLQAQFWYWVEDREAHGRALGPDDVLYPRSAAILYDIRNRMQEVLDRTAPGQLRREDRALLLVGLAVAEDYLGLIERKRALRLPGSHLEHWVNAREHFEKCRVRALAAGEALTETRDGPTQVSLSTAFAEDLVQHRLWALIGQANVARTLDDRESAIAAFLGVIEHMQEMIEREQGRAAKSQERGMHDDYLIALYPQLWLRASEMLKIVLNCEEVI